MTRSSETRIQIAVIGAAEASVIEGGDAFQVGRALAERGAVVLTGGRGGVMEAACRGAQTAGGLTVGIVPGDIGNPYLDIVIRTGMGTARNAILVRSADAVIAVGGKYGTLSEIALALGDDIPVFGLRTWDIPGVVTGSSPDDVVQKAMAAAAARVIVRVTMDQQ